MSHNLNKPEGKKRPAPRSAFRKGQSGNPSGRPKVPEDVRLAFREMTPLAVRVLREIAENPLGDAGVRVRAAETILNRAWGTPVQMTDVRGELSVTRGFWVFAEKGRESE